MVKHGGVLIEAGSAYHLQLSAVKALGERALARRRADPRAAAQRQRGVNRQRQPLLRKR